MPGSDCSRERSQTLCAMGEMASEIAHQIRNPLGGIELITSILGRETAGDGNKQRLVEQILSGVNQVNHLITNYLDLAGNPKPDFKPVNLADLVVETVGSVSHALEAQEAEIRVNTPEFEPLVSGRFRADGPGFHQHHL